MVFANRAKVEIDVYDNPGNWRTISGSWQPKTRFRAYLTTQCGRHNCVSGRPCLIQLINSFSETTNPPHQQHDVPFCGFSFIICRRRRNKADHYSSHLLSCIVNALNKYHQYQQHDLFRCLFHFCSATIRLIHNEMYCAYYATYSHSCVAPYLPYDQLASS